MKKFAPRNGATRASGERGAGSKPRPGKAGRPQAWARKLCEDFAPRNGRTRASGQRGANRALEKPTGPRRGRGNCVKILLPGTEEQGLADSGEQTAPGKTRPAACGGRGRRAALLSRKE